MKRSLQYYMRMVHRVLGYLAIGMVMAYAVSGITLIHRTGNFMKHDQEVSLTLKPGMDVAALAGELKMKNFKVSEETEQSIIFNDGKYDKKTGAITYVKKEYASPINKLVELHKLPDAKNPHIAVVTTIFGVVLFLLALTSLFMYTPKMKQFKANMLYTAIGVAITVILLLCL